MRVTISILFPGLSLLALAACDPSYDSAQGAVPASQVCEATLYDALKGEPIEVVDSLNTPLQVRVLAADSFVPRDFDGSRLTFTESPKGTVSRIFCG
ncbi:hypothetical protein AB0T83_03810 [Fluviibacterium sp. DFM31]|uniref:Peptidase inhibitor I78 family protein n=1 Tax=Meridianimarinicoccus marinus TaxID=3231483 RepID=A0ABV3L335_9RHOB